MQVKTNGRIVILGAAGFIGYHLGKSLSESITQKIILVDNFIRGEKDSQFLEILSRSNVELQELDLSLDNSYRGLFGKGDIVLNCAALNGTQNFYENPVGVIRNSSIPGVLAPEFAAKANVSKYIYFGSAESYAGAVNLGISKIPTSEDVPLVIENPLNLRWSYAASKTMGEIAAIANHFQAGLNAKILRVHNIYGPRMGLKHVIPDLVLKFTSGNFEVHGVNESRAFMYIDDLVYVIKKLVFSKTVDEDLIYHLGSTREIKIKDLAKIILRLLEIKNEIQPLESFDGSVLRRIPNTHKIKSLLDFKETNLEIGISEYIDWFKKYN